MYSSIEECKRSDEEFEHFEMQSRAHDATFSQLTNLIGQQASDTTIQPPLVNQPNPNQTSDHHQQQATTVDQAPTSESSL